MTFNTDVITPLHAHACHVHSALECTANSRNTSPEKNENGLLLQQMAMRTTHEPAKKIVKQETGGRSKRLP